MRKFLVSLLIIGAVSLSARAQAPLHGLKTGYVAATYTGEVLPGQMDNFKQLVSKIVAAVAKEEPGTFMYEWTFHPDGKTFDVLEVYQNSDAVGHSSGSRRTGSTVRGRESREPIADYVRFRSGSEGGNIQKRRNGPWRRESRSCVGHRPATIFVAQWHIECRSCVTTLATANRSSSWLASIGAVANSRCISSDAGGAPSSLARERGA
jgi:quinol monooxygenase YgiN